MKIWILESAGVSVVVKVKGEKGSGFIRFKNICSVTERMRHIVGFMADGVGTASGSSTQSRRTCSSGSGSWLGIGIEACERAESLHNCRVAMWPIKLKLPLGEIKVF